jgi:flagellar basal-body rod modification protein FlgD
MTTTNILAPSTPQVTPTPAKSELDRDRFSQDFDDFLNLLMTQLQNQDPTQPMDTNEFTQQVVQLSTVEQAINTNTNLEKLINTTNNTQNSNIVAWTGKMVEVQGNNVVLGEQGTQFAYELANEVEQVAIRIERADGTLVFTSEGTKNIGRNTVTWDGKDNNGNAMQPGEVYRVQVTSKNSDGQFENVKTLVGGRVDGVNMSVNPPRLLVNDQEIPLDEVNFIGQQA